MSDDSENASTPRTTDELLAGIRQLERELAAQRRFGRRSLKDLHRTLIGDLRASEKQARQAQRRAERAEADALVQRRRATAAEAELAAVKQSTTWKTGRAVLAVPSRLRHRSR